MVVTNNWRTLHGRVSVPTGMPRTPAFGYVNKLLVLNPFGLRMLQDLGFPFLWSATASWRWLT